MTTSQTGLGEPEIAGKQALFQPVKRPAKRKTKPAPQRIRTTLELTHQALAVLQEIQNRHRLKTGKVLPLWKAVSDVIEHFEEK